MDFLERGVRRFKRRVFPENRALFRRLAAGQSPRVLFITCADSRVVPSLITQTQPGELFVERNPGNIVPVYSRRLTGEGASIEYAVDVLGVKHIVVCGHTNCGAVKGMLHPETLEEMPAVKRWLADGKRSQRWKALHLNPLSEARKLELLTGLNVAVQVDRLRAYPCVARQLRRRRVTLHGWVYRIHDGEILQFDERTNAFRPWP